MTRLPFWIFISIFAAYFSLWIFVTTQPYRVAPPNHTYTILGKNFFYPNMILQGKDGAWGIIDSHSIRHTARAYTQFYFILLGKIAAIFAIHQVTMYQMARIVGAFFLFVAVYRLVRVLMPQAYQAIAIFFILGLETGPLLTSPFQPSFDYQVSYERLFGLPHHLAGEAFGLLLLAELVLAVRHPKTQRALPLALLTLATALILPPYLVILGLTVMTVWFVWALIRGEHARIIPPFFLVTAIFGAAGMLLKMEFAKGLPWTVWTATEKGWWDTQTLLMQYVSSLLLYAPGMLLLWSIALFQWKKINTHLQWLILTMTAWVMFPFFLIPLAKTTWFPVANFRLIDATQYVPAGILAALGFGLTRRAVRVTLTILLVTGSLLLTAHYTNQTLDKQKTLWSNIYPHAETWKAVTTLHNYVEKGSGVMVREYFGEILPAFANVAVFIGGPHGFPDWPERQRLAIEFFSGKFSPSQAEEFLTRERISYVWFGPDEQAVNETGSLYPTLLLPIFATDTVTVYRITHAVP